MQHRQICILVSLLNRDNLSKGKPILFKTDNCHPGSSPRAEGQGQLPPFRPLNPTLPVRHRAKALLFY